MQSQQSAGTTSMAESGEIMISQTPRHAKKVYCTRKQVDFTRNNDMKYRQVEIDRIGELATSYAYMQAWIYACWHLFMRARIQSVNHSFIHIFIHFGLMHEGLSSPSLLNLFSVIPNFPVSNDMRQKINKV